GVRVAVSVAEAKGTIAKIANAIASVGGDIVGLGLSDPTPTSGEDWEITFKVQGVAKDKLVDIIRPVVRKILDVRET
ncbi:MAG TPA: hypothetical protein VF478_10760, partial [Anaerolineae bacterium]